MNPDSEYHRIVNNSKVFIVAYSWNILKFTTFSGKQTNLYTHKYQYLHILILCDNSRILSKYFIILPFY